MDRGHQTELVATRVMKARARCFVYDARAKATQNPALENVAALEREIMRDTEREWRTTAAMWRSPLDRETLIAILTKAKGRARREVYVAFDDKITADNLAKYFESFEPEDLIPSEGTS
jgi:hypothetical protein